MPSATTFTAPRHCGRPKRTSPTSDWHGVDGQAQRAGHPHHEGAEHFIADIEVIVGEAAALVRQIRGARKGAGWISGVSARKIPFSGPRDGKAGAAASRLAN